MSRPDAPADVEPTYWVETFDRRLRGQLRPKARMRASSEESAMAAMRVAATLEIGAAVLRIDRCLRSGEMVRIEVVKVMGRAPANYAPSLPCEPVVK